MKNIHDYIIGSTLSTYSCKGEVSLFTLAKGCWFLSLELKCYSSFKSGL